MWGNFKVLSLSHKKASVEIRELIYLPEASCKQLLQQIHSVLGLEEVMILSTCNRTEIYYLHESDRSEELVSLLGIEKGLDNPGSYLKYFDCILNHRDAIEYLFEVSMGLHSQVIGDLQISNQVKNAYAWSAEYKLAGPFLHRLMHTIFHTNKRVHHETAFRDGAASVSYASAELVQDLTEHLVEPKFLIIGMGEMGQDVARNLAASAKEHVTLCNRTDAKAHTLSAELGTNFLPYESVKSSLGEFNVIISCVTAPEPLLLKDDFEKIDSLKTQFLIDLSVPRSIDISVDQIEGMVVYNIDEIQVRTNEVLKKRLDAIESVRAIVTEEIGNFSEWSKELNISPTINRLKDALEQIRKEEIAKFLKNADKDQADLIEKVTKSMVHKIIKLPVLQLKAACKRGEEDTLIDVLNDLFNLEKVQEKKKA